MLDVVAVLTDQPDYKKVRNYWKWLKNKLIAEGSQLVSATNQLKLPAADGKKYGNPPNNHRNQKLRSYVALA